MCRIGVPGKWSIKIATRKLIRQLKRSPDRRLKLAIATQGQLTVPEHGSVEAQTDDLIDAGRTEGVSQVDLSERLGVLEAPEDPSRRTIHAAASQAPLIRLMRAMRRAWLMRGQIAQVAASAPIVAARRVYHRRPWRALTPEEKFQRVEEKRRAEMASLLASEANLYWDRLVNALDRNQFMHTQSKTAAGGGAPKTKHVSFDVIKLQPEAIYFRINTMHLPYGTRISDLMDKDLILDLSVACGRRVTAEYSERIGAWYIVERAIGVRGIPDHVKFVDLLEAMPASADGLTVPIGMSLNAKPIYKSLGRMYSMLVAGTIGGGKSNFLNVMLITLIRRNTPQQLRLILVDLKGGLEFQFYEGLPHLISIPGNAPNGICDNTENVPGVLDWLHEEGERRMNVLRKAGYKSIGRYNAYQRKRRLPHILLVIDEWADVMYHKDIKKDCEETLANVAQRFRAVGIHCVICTQIPKAEVVSMRIKGVLPAKLAFSVPSNHASQIIIDTGRASQLTPAGRAIYQWDEEYEVQTPFINEDIIDHVVQQAISGKSDAITSGHDVTHLEVLEWALSQENGYLSRDVLFRQFGKRGLKQEELNNWLSDWEGQELVIGTSLYRVDPAAGNRPRRLIAIDENADGIPDDQQDLSEDETEPEDEDEFDPDPVEDPENF